MFELVYIGDRGFLMNEVLQFVELDDAGFVMVMKDREIYHRFMDGLSFIHDLVADHSRLAPLFIENALQVLFEGDLPESIKLNLQQNYQTAKTIKEQHMEKKEIEEFTDSLSRFYTGLRLVEKDW
jgi:hypothetical protein